MEAQGGETLAARLAAQHDSAPGHGLGMPKQQEVPESRSSNVVWGTDTPAGVK